MTALYWERTLHLLKHWTPFGPAHDKAFISVQHLGTRLWRN